jgi:16S rRNA processing protein RimM
VAAGNAPSKRICLGVVAGAHGVRGLVKIKSFTEAPGDLLAYGPLSDEAGTRRFEITVKGMAKGSVLAAMTGIDDRDAAQALKGTRLYVDRAALPAADEEETYYHADLVGLRAEDRDGGHIGRVAAVHNFGAGDLLEIARGEDEPELLVPFTKAAVPEVDLKGGRLVIDPPAEIVAERSDD